MSKFINKISPEWALRMGLGVMYVYSGIDILRHPTAWYWAVRPLFRFLPVAVQPSFTRTSFVGNFLRVQGFAELLFAFILLAWFLNKKFPKWVAGFTALEMAAILLLIPIDAVTFRDFGLLGAGLALFLLLRREFKGISDEKPSSMPQNKTENQLAKEGEPLVQTFDQFIGK